MAKTTFKLENIAMTIEGNPIEIKGLEITTEASAQELATAGGNINKLVEIIGDIADRFDNNNHPVVKEIEVNPVKVEPVKVKEPITDFREVKEKTEKPELPTATFSGGEPLKKFNITKEWRKISVPNELKPNGTDKYSWCGDTIGEIVSVNGGTYGVVYINIKSMGQKSFIIVRPENVKFEDDIKPDEFQDFLEVINIPQEIKDYIKKVISL